MNRKQVLVLGDSHTEIFIHPMLAQGFAGISFEVVTVIGATASGLENPNTKTRAYPIFKEALAASQAERVLVMLGEVDTGFVIWYRAQKYGEAVAAMAERAIESYGRFLREAAEGREVVCISTPLPTIQGGRDFGEVANLRREVTATLQERTALTLDFNRRMQEFCLANGIDYIMLDEASTGPDGVVRQELLNRDPNDHHYDADHYAAMLAQHLAPVLRAG